MPENAGLRTRCTSCGRKANVFRDDSGALRIEPHASCTEPRWFARFYAWIERVPYHELDRVSRCLHGRQPLRDVQRATIQPR